jgi:membrane-associated protein
MDGPVLDYVLDFILHLDREINALAGLLGPWTYAALFLVVFCETGLVITPFLPGDSLLFAIGALAAVSGSTLDLGLAAVVLCAAAVTGDAVNYACGYWVGPRVFTSTTSPLLNRKHLLRTHTFYEKHGGKTIVLARFIPIIRTFAPFVAGIAKMRYGRFAVFNLTGALGWVLGFLLAGYLFGNLPAVKKNFSMVILAIIVVSLLPALREAILARRAAARAEAAGGGC